MRFASNPPHGLRQTKLRRLLKVNCAFTFAAAYNLVRAPKLIAAEA